MSSLPEVVVKVQGALLHLVPAQNPINFLPFVLDPIWLHFRWRAAVLLFLPQLPTASLHASCHNWMEGDGFLF